MKTVHATDSRKRDLIVKRVKLRKDGGPALNEAFSALRAWLHGHKKKNTPEREAVLSILYRIDSPIDIDTLHALVVAEYAQTCQTSTYNAIQTLMEAHLVQKVMLLDGSRTFYERANLPPHGYGLCEHCGQIWTLQLDNLEAIHNQLPGRFRTDALSLIVKGRCYKCQVAENREMRLKAIAERKELERKQKELAKAKLRRERQKAALDKKKKKTDNKK